VFADFGATASGFDADLSGIDLAIARCSGWLRRIIWIDLIGGLFLPIGMAGPESGLADWGVGLACWAVKLVAAVLCLSGVGTLLGHVAKRDRPDLVGLAALVALLTVIVVLASAGTT
jgi:hypothetical protein